MIQAWVAWSTFPWNQTDGVYGKMQPLLGLCLEDLNLNCWLYPPPQSHLPNIYEWFLVHVLLVIPLALELNVHPSCFLLFWSLSIEIPYPCDPTRSWGLKTVMSQVSLFYCLFLTSFCKTIPFKVRWHTNFPLTPFSYFGGHFSSLKAV